MLYNTVYDGTSGSVYKGPLVGLFNLGIKTEVDGVRFDV